MRWYNDQWCVCYFSHMDDVYEKFTRWCIIILIIYIRILKELNSHYKYTWSWHEYSLGMIRIMVSLKSLSKNYCNVGSGNARQERTVLKGLIGHSNSSGDQAPWECDGKNPVSCAELSTVPTSLFITPNRRMSSHLATAKYGMSLRHRRSLYLATAKYYHVCVCV